MNYKTLLIATTVATLLLSGCGDDKNTTLQDSLKGNTVEDKIAGYAVFNPKIGEVPYPNNIFFAENSSSTNDYDYGKTLNIPYEPEDANKDLVRQLNTLTGFSTTSPITAPITATLDLSTIPAGVQVYKVNIDPNTGAVTSISDTLNFGVDFVATQSANKLAIIPIHPLDSLTNYMVVMTSELKDAQGRILSPDYVTALTLSSKPIEASGPIDEKTAAGLERIRQGNQAMFIALAKAGKDPRNTVQIWNFRTQLIGEVQKSIAESANSNPTAQLALQSTQVTTKQIVESSLGIEIPSMFGIADAYVGILSNLPQFMPQASQTNPAPALYGTFSFDGSFLPKIEANVTVATVATVPNALSQCVKPADGWPVIIYQHGITRNRTDLFMYAETFASRCYASVAIDLPLHGLTDKNIPLYADDLERTFNIDVVTEDSNGNIIAAEPDGIIDSSGTHYINLSNISTTRDNLHQSTSDLLQLQHALESAQGIDLDSSRIHFVAHSLGTIASTGYLNHTDALSTITLAMPGQGLAQLLNNSMTYGPIIAAGLAQKGIEKGSSDYASFMLATQTIVDDADPANYTISVGQKHPNNILAFEVIGTQDPDNTAPCQIPSDSDDVIPNCVQTAPLSGTDPYLSSIKTQELNLTDGNAGVKLTPNNTVTKLVAGNHRSPLIPDIATREIHTEIISFIDSNGTALIVVDPSIIKH